MTYYVQTNEKCIGLAAAGAAMLGLSLCDGLLQPAGRLQARAAARAAAAQAADTESAHAAEPVHSPIALPVPPAVAVQPAAEPADELPEHDIDAAFDNFMTR